MNPVIWDPKDVEPLEDAEGDGEGDADGLGVAEADADGLAAGAV